MVFLGIVGAAFHYITYRAMVTKWLWSRYPSWLDALMSCAACSGFWIGGGLGLLARARGYGLLGMEPSDWLLLPAAAAVTMVLAPITASIQISALTALSEDDAAEED
jgi:hypothetical protein